MALGLRGGRGALAQEVLAPGKCARAGCFERARIGLAASKGDWPRRIAEYARDDQEDAAAYAANY